MNETKKDPNVKSKRKPTPKRTSTNWGNCAWKMKDGGAVECVVAYHCARGRWYASASHSLNGKKVRIILKKKKSAKSSQIRRE